LRQDVMVAAVVGSGSGMVGVGVALLAWAHQHFGSSQSTRLTLGARLRRLAGYPCLLQTPSMAGKNHDEVEHFFRARGRCGGDGGIVARGHVQL